MPASATESPQSRSRAGRRALTLMLGIGVVASAACSNRTDLSTASSTSAVDPAVSVSTSSPGTDPGTTQPDAPTTTTEPSTTTTSTTIAATTTTTIPLVTEGAVVLIANASGVPGAAGRLTETLRSLGFHVAEPTNAAGNEESLDASKVYARPEAEGVGASIARIMGGIPASRMPTPAPIVDATAGLGDATVLVMLGKDLADVTPPGLPAG